MKMSIKKLLDKGYLSHNEYFCFHVPTNGAYIQIWEGEGWKIPQSILKQKTWRIFGTIPETIMEADHINIVLYDMDVMEVE